MSIEVAQPHRTADGVWRTPVALHGLDGRLPDICGVDSFQSLCLATAAIRRRLSSIAEHGERFLDNEGADFPIDAYFPKQ
jgi:hypothetical protein